MERYYYLKTGKRWIIIDRDIEHDTNDPTKAVFATTNNQDNAEKLVAVLNDV